jgi:hypothetical protein
VKRNCIRLTWRERSKEVPQDSKPFYLFSDNCSEKEDFYHALLQNQDRIPGYTSPPPTPLGFETAHIIKLVQQLHASEENMQTRWINALMGRLFLSVYKTSDIQHLLHTKITKKISRVAKPAFIESIKVKHIDLGDSAPLLTNPKLRELTIDGDLIIEGDVKYKGNLRLEIAAVAVIDLGPRFKARRVDLLLAGICKALEGHILIRVKPPPSNRIWFSFDTMPKLDLSIEPIVSSRQITYSLILRAIESRIREVIGDTLVLPNWDDIPFSDTSPYKVRGGLWAEQSAFDAKVDAPASFAESFGTPDSDPEVESMVFPQPDKSMSTPTLIGRRKTSRNNDMSDSSVEGGTAVGVSSALDLATETQKPRTLRTNSFATVASPVLSMDPATVQAIKDQSAKGKHDATKVMKDISSRSQPASPFESPVGSPAAHEVLTATKPTGSPKIPSTSSSDIGTVDHTIENFDAPSRTSTEISFGTDGSASISDRRSLSKSTTSSSSQKRQSIAANAVLATVAARKWGLDLVTRHASTTPGSASPGMVGSSSNHEATKMPTSEGPTKKRATAEIPTEPIGRGLPLPPPGTPLPGPLKPSWTSALSGLAKRKAVPDSSGRRASNPVPKPVSNSPSPPPLPQRPTLANGSSGESISSPRPVPTPPLPRRKVRTSSLVNDLSEPPSTSADDVLVIKAPDSPADSASRDNDDAEGVFTEDWSEDVPEETKNMSMDSTHIVDSLPTDAVSREEDIKPLEQPSSMSSEKVQIVDSLKG